MPACAMELPPVEGRLKDGARRCTRQRSPGNALLDNALPRTVSPVVVRHARCVAYWCPSMAIADVWVFRIVHQDTGKPAQGVPVTVLDSASNPAGYWVSEADGTVSVPRRPGPRLRLRVGLRNEEPIELVTARLGEGVTDLAAPSWVPLASGTPERVMAAVTPRGGGAEPQRSEERR